MPISLKDMIPCTVDGCPNKVYSRRSKSLLCQDHAAQMRKYGDPIIRIRRRRGTGHFDMLGYKKLSINGRSIREHRYVMEQAMGRRLTAAEVVHHKDGNKLNNSLDNLELTTRADHQRRLHPGNVVAARKALRTKHQGAE